MDSQGCRFDSPRGADLWPVMEGWNTEQEDPAFVVDGECCVCFDAPIDTGLHPCGCGGQGRETLSGDAQLNAQTKRQCKTCSRARNVQFLYSKSVVERLR